MSPEQFYNITIDSLCSLIRCEIYRRKQLNCTTSNRELNGMTEIAVELGRYNWTRLYPLRDRHITTEYINWIVEDYAIKILTDLGYES